MSDDRNRFEPMLNIPSMEELDRQWREMQPEQNQRKTTGTRGGSSARSGKASTGRSANGRTQKTSTGRSANGRTQKPSTGRNASGQAQKTSNSQGTGGQDPNGKAAVSRKERKAEKKKKPKKFKKLRLFLKIFFLIILLATLGVLVFFYYKYGDDLLHWKNEAKKIVEASNMSTFRSSETSMIYASNKKPIARLKGDKDSYYLDFEDIPKEAIDCMVATEDRDFYEHSGVNFLSTAKAAFLYIKGKITGDDSITRGGSTITQQLAKNIFLTNEQTEERKIREMFIAIELEQKYEKNEIMEFYINNICFANGHFGLEAASRAYFSRSAKELSLAEIAFLCAIPNIPTYYDPLQHYDHTQSRKERVLKQMLEQNKISAAEYSDANYETIILKPAETIKTQDYTTTYAIACATKELMKRKGFEFQTEFKSDAEEEEYEKEYKELYEECHSSLYTGGYQIYTSLNPGKQKKLQKAVNQTLSGFKEKTKDGIYTLQGAATCIDNETGFVVAIVGGRKQKDTVGYTLNRAYQSFRQPGSSFKPLVVYTPQLERSYTPNTIVDDTYFEGGPRTSGGVYLGKIPLRTAVEKSKNVVAWKLFEELTPAVGLSYVKKMYFSEIVDTDYFPAASLGGLTNGASTVEMASAYATIENSGVYRDPTCIKKILNADEKVIVDNTRSQTQKQIYEENAARMMTDILTGVLIRGTAAGRGVTNMSCAGKTGTTTEQKDGWFCGFTPYYTTAVWVGYDSPKYLSDLYGNTYPLTIWREYMNQIHEGLEDIGFPEYSSNSSNNNDDSDNQYEPEPTIEPDALDEPEEPAATKKPKATKTPVATPAPTPVTEPDPTIDPNDDPDIDDIPDDNSDVDDIPDTLEE